MIEIRKINASETIFIRHSVLRVGKPIATCYFEGDDLPTTNHFGLYYKNKQVAVISVFESKNQSFIDENQHQIRGMAVLPEYQKRGFGEQLLKQCENEIKIKNGNLIWFNARESAIEFYKKFEYVIMGDKFEIPYVGMHYVMKKTLKYC